jgi:hypothetical protein
MRGAEQVPAYITRSHIGIGNFVLVALAHPCQLRSNVQSHHASLQEAGLAWLGLPIHLLRTLQDVLLAVADGITNTN